MLQKMDQNMFSIVSHFSDQISTLSCEVQVLKDIMQYNQGESVLKINDYNEKVLNILATQKVEAEEIKSEKLLRLRK